MNMGNAKSSPSFPATVHPLIHHQISQSLLSLILSTTLWPLLLVACHKSNASSESAIPDPAPQVSPSEDSSNSVATAGDLLRRMQQMYTIDAIALSPIKSCSLKCVGDRPMLLKKTEQVEFESNHTESFSPFLG